MLPGIRSLAVAMHLEIYWVYTCYLSSCLFVGCVHLPQLHGDVAVRRNIQRLFNQNEKISAEQAEKWLAELSTTSRSDAITDSEDH
ncbi:hypothetical protein F0L16_21790 [Photorhabdus heterorhabditis]|uniref:Uncharacterized protein n=1 Tax=Photorhabdus heterorhabditis TaxID=880156 RepID=A0A5B0VA85_9GAMM|nr:hypothetical protein F0L16_21790 [Photorhabdus heterorhabditis]